MFLDPSFGKISFQKNRTWVIQPLPTVGDMVNYIPLLRGISAASKTGRVCLLATESSRARQLLGGESFIDHVAYLKPHDFKGITGALSMGRTLKNAGCDRVYVLHHSLRYHLAAIVSGAEQRMGYGFGYRQLFLTQGPFLKKSHQSLETADLIRSFADLLGIDYSPDDFTLTPSKTAQQQCRQKWSHLPRPWITVGFGVTAGLKPCSPSFFGQTLKQLDTGGTFFLVDSPRGKTTGSNILGHLPSDIRGRTLLLTDRPFDENITLLSLADFFVGNDVGLLNVSAALKIPSFGLFSGSSSVMPSHHLIPIIPPDDGGPKTLDALAPAHVCDTIRQWFTERKTAP